MWKTLFSPPAKPPDKLTSTMAEISDLYNDLLREYVEYLETQPFNPYETSLKKRLVGFFDFKSQFDLAKSTELSNFIKSPNTLAQDLPGAKDFLEKLDKFDNNTLNALSKLNSMNLFRLRRRSVTSMIVPGIAFAGSVIGLVPSFQQLISISIDPPIAGVSWLSLAFLLKLFMLFVVVLGLGNWIITRPRVSLVEAFGDILKIALYYRNVSDEK